MTLPRCAADVLADHVLFEIEAIDRMYLNMYQPRLQHGAGIAAFFVGHRGHRFASSALMAPMTTAFTANIGHFVAARGLDMVRFAPVGFQNSAAGSELGFYAARSYSLMRPPRTGRRWIRFLVRSATGWSGRGGRSWRSWRLR